MDQCSQLGTLERETAQGGRMSELDAPHAPLDNELHAVRHPRPDRLIQDFEWTPITDAQNADEPELTDEELAKRGLFRVIPSLAERAGIAPNAIVDYEGFRRVLERAYPVSKKIKKGKKK
jgi:hypothetical protein